jgi:hypothetical protein
MHVNYEQKYDNGLTSPASGKSGLKAASRFLIPSK